MHVIICSILINVRKCSAKSSRKPPRNFRVRVCVWVIFWVRTRVAVYVSLRRIEGTSRPLFSVFLATSGGEVYKRGEGTLIEIGIHLIEYISGYDSTSTVSSWVIVRDSAFGSCT